MKLNIMSIFFSISGEVNIWPQGTPCVFVRLAGCNLNCHYCDTKNSINAVGEEMAIDKIIAKVEEFKCKRVLITGGEPLLQKRGVEELIKELHKIDYQVSIETNGSKALNIWPAPDCWITDIKMPASGMFERMLGVKNHLQTANGVDVIFKFPIENIGDFRKASEIIKSHDPEDAVFALSPVSPLMANTLWQWMVEYELTHVVLSIQIHKVIWPDSKIER